MDQENEDETDGKMILVKHVGKSKAKIVFLGKSFQSTIAYKKKSEIRYCNMNFTIL